MTEEARKMRTKQSFVAAAAGLFHCAMAYAQNTVLNPDMDKLLDKLTHQRKGGAGSNGLSLTLTLSPRERGFLFFLRVPRALPWG